MRPFLIPLLTTIAEEWRQASGLPLTTLGNRAVLSAGVFDRIATGNTITVANWERLMIWLANADNWPDNAIPLAAADLLDRLDAIATEGRASPDNAAEDIGVAA